MRRKLILLVVLVVVALGALTITKPKQLELVAPTTVATSTATSTPLVVKTTPPKIVDKDTLIKDEAWNVLLKYLAAVKAHDLTTIKLLSYQLSNTCKDDTKTKECNALMDNAYSYGYGLHKQDITHVEYDSEQIILTSDYQESLDGEMPSLLREIVYFVRVGDEIKFLSFNPFQGSFITRGTLATTTISTHLLDLTKDNDNDGLPNETEMCIDMTSAPDCVKTDPNMKDSNGNGWWDSIEALFYK